MPGMQAMSCANCGATLYVGDFRSNIIECQYCGTSFREAASLTPQPEMGDLILGADFRDPKVPGWVISFEDKVEFKNDPDPELWATFTPGDVIYPVIRTPGIFDDFDVGVTIRFMEGSHDHISAGFELRFDGDKGDYVFRISAQGTFQVGWHKAKEWGDTLVGWTTHPSLRTEMGAANRLRVVLQGNKIRVYLNGVLATSLRDERYSSGLVRVVVSPYSKKPNTVVAFSDLQLREVDR
jgi:hypothetical protein